MPPQQQQQNLAVPIAIVVAGLAIAGALFFSGRANQPPASSDPETSVGDASQVPLVTTSDHILGDPNAPIKVIEYTDFECPYCKKFHITMEEIMNTYGKAGEVAWVMRNFPIVQLHPNAPAIAEAAECVAALAGNAAYWNFLTELFTIAPQGSFFPLDRLSETATKVGTNAGAFDLCVTKRTYKDLVATQFNDAVATGGEGTPHNIIVTNDGQFIPISGAQPYATLKSVIDSLLLAN
jgi:protein-disulfide isomerase